MNSYHLFYENTKESADNVIQSLLQQCDEKLSASLSDMDRDIWMHHRELILQIHLQDGYPENVCWCIAPDVEPR